MRFDDDKHLIEYYKYKQYPKIHDDIYNVSRKINPNNNVIDLGCCFGLLSDRLASHFNKVIGIESNYSYLERAIKNPKISYFNLKVTDESIADFENLIKREYIKVLVARRVIPELYETGGFELLYLFIKMLYNNKIEYIVLEGRKPTKLATNPLSNIDKEASIFNKYYKLEYKYKNCALLRRKNE